LYTKLLHQWRYTEMTNSVQTIHRQSIELVCFGAEKTGILDLWCHVILDRLVAVTSVPAN